MMTKKICNHFDLEKDEEEFTENMKFQTYVIPFTVTVHTTKSTMKGDVNKGTAVGLIYEFWSFIMWDNFLRDYILGNLMHSCIQSLNRKAPGCKKSLQ